MAAIVGLMLIVVITGIAIIGLLAADAVAKRRGKTNGY